jgi:hypothetical protein
VAGFFIFGRFPVNFYCAVYFSNRFLGNTPAIGKVSGLRFALASKNFPHTALFCSFLIASKQFKKRKIYPPLV